MLLRGVVPVFAALCAVLGACATPVPQLASQLGEKPVCCESIDQMEFTPLPGDKDTRAKLDSNSPAYTFDGGKSYFLAFRLPAGAADRDLQITTYISGASTFDDSVFYPQLIVLDATWQIRRKLPAPGVRYEVSLLQGAQWITRVALEPQDTYLVIHTTPAIFEYGLPVPGSGGHAGVIGTMPYYSPGSAARLVPAGPIGTLLLSWVKRESTRSTAGAGAAATALPPLDKPGATVLTGSLVERSLLDWDGFHVAAVDDQRVDYGWTGNPFTMPISLVPGAHTVLVQFRTTQGAAMGDWPDAVMQVRGDLQANHRYRVVGSIDNGVATAWIEDAEGGQRISEPATGSMYWLKPLRMGQLAGK